MKICFSCNYKYDAKGWVCPACKRSPEEVSGYSAPARRGQKRDYRYHDDYLELLNRIEPRHFWFQARSRLINWLLQRNFPRAKRFLEIGCGTGYILSGIKQTFPHLSLCATDTNVTALELARRKVPDSEYLIIDARDNPFFHEFDVVGIFDVLEHINEDNSVLDEIHKSLKNNGGLLISVPQHPILWSSMDEGAGHLRRYRRKELEDKLKKSGFRIVDAISFVSLLFPALLLFRTFYTYKEGTAERIPEVDIGPLLNAILSKIMNFERLLIRMGVRFPFGGSLFIVACKE